MDLNHLRSFAAVAQLGHLTRAAEKLHLSQPALSSHIKTLEEQFGVMLFERTPSGMAITPAGRRLLTEVEEILASVARLGQSAQGLRGQPTGTLRIGTVLDPDVVRVGDLMSRSLERYPQLELELHHVLSSDAIARVRSGELDGSFYFGELPADLTGIPLRDLVYRVVLPAAWGDRLANASWEEIAHQPWVLAPAPSSHRQLVMDLFREPTPPPERLIEADNESVINNLVESGVGVSLIRDEVAAPSVEAGRCVVWPGLSVTTRLWFVTTKAGTAEPLLDVLLAVLRDVWAIPARASETARQASADPARQPLAESTFDSA